MNKFDPIEEALRKGPEVPEGVSGRLKEGVDKELYGSAAAASTIPAWWIPAISIAALALVGWGVFTWLPDSGTGIDPLSNTSSGEVAQVERGATADQAQGALATGDSFAKPGVDVTPVTGVGDDSVVVPSKPAVYGVVRAASGQPLADAEVELSFTAGARGSKRTLRTDANGVYQLPLHELSKPAQAASNLGVFIIDSPSSFDEQWEEFQELAKGDPEDVPFESVQPQIAGEYQHFSEAQNVLTERMIAMEDGMHQVEIDFAQANQDIADGIGSSIVVRRDAVQRSRVLDAQSEVLKKELQMLMERRAAEASSAAAGVPLGRFMGDESLDATLPRASTLWSTRAATGGFVTVSVGASAQGFRDPVRRRLRLSGNERVRVDIEMADSYELVGRVVDSNDQPIEGAAIMISASQNEFVKPGGATPKTNDEGEFRVPLLPSGAYAIVIRAPGFAIFEGVTQAGQNQLYSLRRSPTINLSLRDPEGAPLAAARVMVQRMPAHSAAGSQDFTADDEGRVQIVGMEAGELEIRVRQSHQKLSMGDGNVVFVNPSQVEVSETIVVDWDETVDHEMFVPTVVSIEGILLDAPAEDTRLVVYPDAEGEQSPTTAFVKDGEFKLTSLLPGDYVFAVALRSKTGWSLRSTEFVHISAQPAVQQVTLPYAPVPFGNLSVRVVDTEGEVVPAATVAMHRGLTGGRAPRPAVDGVMSLGLFPDTFGLEVSAKGFKTGFRSGVVVRSGETTEVEVVLEPAMDLAAEMLTLFGESTLMLHTPTQAGTVLEMIDELSPNRLVIDSKLAELGLLREYVSPSHRAQRITKVLADYIAKVDLDWQIFGGRLHLRTKSL